MLDTIVVPDFFGSRIVEGGVVFRVWAPHADKLFVMGSFNEWDPGANELVRDEEGNWFGEVPGASAGDEYKYVIHHNDQVLYRIDPRARQVTNSNGNGVIYEDRFEWGNDKSVIPDWNKLIIYEMHIGSFHVKEEGRPGSFYTAIEKLDYLAKMGVNAVEVMPPFEFAGGFSWGYNPAHPFAVESEYGGPDAFKSFVKTCHEKGIAVILDIVFNHFGPGDLDLWQFDGWSENGKGGIYFYNDHRSHTPWGDTRPDYGRGEVRLYLMDNIRMWLDEYHVDGLRFDAVSYITNINGERNPDSDIPEGHTLLKWINGVVREQYPGRIMIAEDMKSSTYVTGLSEQDGLAYSAQWDPGFVHNVRDVLQQPEDRYRDLEKIRQALYFKYRDDVFSRIIYTESHDETANGRARVAEEIMPGDVDNWYALKRSALGIVLVLTSPGIPMLFQGQIMNQGGWFADDRPLDWTKATENKGLARLTKDLLRLRLDETGTTRGLTGQHLDVFLIDQERKVLGFRRWFSGGEKDDTIVLLNFGDRVIDEVEIHLPGAYLWKLRFNSNWEGYFDGFGNFEAGDLDLRGTEHSTWKLSLPPYSALIYSADQA